METKQTAVEWLVMHLAKKHNEFQALTFYHEHYEEITQAKQMEKDKIREAYYRGVKDEMQNIGKDFEDYYNETYGPQVDKK